jgi:hypothetical protein
MFSDDVTAVKVKFKKMVDVPGKLHSKLLMSLLNNIYTAEMFKESTMGVGSMVGREKIWSLAFADDLVIVAKSKREIKKMMKSRGKYVRKKSWK